MLGTAALALCIQAAVVPVSSSPVATSHDSAAPAVTTSDTAALIQVLILVIAFLSSVLVLVWRHYGPVIDTYYRAADPARSITPHQALMNRLPFTVIPVTAAAAAAAAALASPKPGAASAGATGANPYASAFGVKPQPVSPLPPFSPPLRAMSVANGVSPSIGAGGGSTGLNELKSGGADIKPAQQQPRNR